MKKNSIVGVDVSVHQAEIDINVLNKDKELEDLIIK